MLLGHRDCGCHIAVIKADQQAIMLFLTLGLVDNKVGFNAVVTCEIELFQNYVSLCRHPSKIISFQHVKCCPKLFRTYFRGLLQLMNIFQHVQCHWNNFEINDFISLSDVVTCETKRWNNFEIQCQSAWMSKFGGYMSSSSSSFSLMTSCQTQPITAAVNIKYKYNSI